VADANQRLALPSSDAPSSGSRRRIELPPVAQVDKEPCPRCKKLNRKEDRVCEWCGRQLRWSTGSQELTERAGLSFAGYAEPKVAKKKEKVEEPREARQAAPATSRPYSRVVRRRSTAPVVEILVAILLLGGAATAIWIMRSSLPAGVVSAGNVKVVVTPASARIARGKALDVLASVSGTENVEVNWSIQEGDAGGQIESRGAKATKGKVWSQAVYSAPKMPGTYHLQAESKADPKKSAVIVITVVNR
jgi:chitinase